MFTSMSSWASSKKSDLSKNMATVGHLWFFLPIASFQKLLGGFEWNLPIRLVSMSSCTSTKPNSGRSTYFTFLAPSSSKQLFAFHQNGKISITLAPGQNRFLLYNWESGFKLDSHLLEIWIKGYLTFPDFSCLKLGQNKFRFNRDTHLRVRPIQS